jgi:hypothetical protein
MPVNWRLAKTLYRAERMLQYWAATGLLYAACCVLILLQVPALLSITLAKAGGRDRMVVA